MVKSMGVGDTVFFGPEAEFFVFDDVKIKADPYNTGFKLNSVEFPSNGDTEYEGGNLGHRIGTKKGYFPVPPQDPPGHALRDARRHGADGGEGREASPRSGDRTTRAGNEVRADDLHGRPDAGLQILHPPGRQHLRQDRDVHAEADLRDNGSGMHCHQSIWKDGKPVFAGNKYADLSEICLSYIAGVIKHAKAINAFTNPTTNSYKRLVPGYEAPVLLAYSARNRSASCRIPYTTNPKAKRVEVRFPDPLANPYLGFAAMLMAGLDGVKHKLDPGAPMDKDLYDLPKAELKEIPTVCGSLREALESLDKDRGFLKAGGVFDDDFIDSYIELKMTEVARFEMTPHPVEFEMYYSG